VESSEPPFHLIEGAASMQCEDEVAEELLSRV
jgi:hypothetical protein